MPKEKPKWKLVDDYPVTDYQCGARAGDRVRLRRDIVTCGTGGGATDVGHRAGEMWTVETGAAEPRVAVWLRRPDGDRHTWVDNASFWDWFERVHEHEG